MPNGLELRPHFFARDNVFVDMVRMLYQADTPTNVFPSLHVFNSLAACIAIYNSETLQKHCVISGASYVLAGLIILATMFLKQHSIYDVIAAFVLAYALYQIICNGTQESSEAGAAEEEYCIQQIKREMKKDTEV